MHKKEQRKTVNCKVDYGRRELSDAWVNQFC